MPITISPEDRKSVPEARLRNFNFGFKGYLYGMRLRGFSPGCQPMKGLVGTMEGIGRYHCVLIYNRELTDEEVRDYELDRLEYEDWKDRNDKG